MPEVRAVQAWTESYTVRSGDPLRAVPWVWDPAERVYRSPVSTLPWRAASHARHLIGALGVPWVPAVSCYVQWDPIVTSAITRGTFVPSVLWDAAPCEARNELDLADVGRVLRLSREDVEHAAIIGRLGGARAVRAYLDAL